MRIYVQQYMGPIYELKEASVDGSVSMQADERALTTIQRQLDYIQEMAVSTQTFVGKLYTREHIYTKIKTVYLVAGDTVTRWNDVILYESDQDLISIGDDILHLYTLRLTRVRHTTLAAFERLLRCQKYAY